MILNHLIRFYENNCSKKGENGVYLLPPDNYKDDSICAVIVLNKNGGIERIEDRLIDKNQGQRLRIPAGPKRTSGIRAFPYVDKSAYVLGLDLVKEEKSEKVTETVDKFNAFKEFNKKLIGDSSDESAKAFCAFLNTWSPSSADTDYFDHKHLNGKLIAFKLDGNPSLLHEEKFFIDRWSSYVDDNLQDAIRGNCYLTGKSNVVLQGTQPAIKGLRGGKAEMSLITYNDNAYESYGKKKSENFMISKDASFKYVSALNYLLSNKRHYYRYSDSTLVYWAEAKNEKSDESYSNLLSMLMSGPTDEQESIKLQEMIEAFSKGKNYLFNEVQLESDTKFYLLAIVPSAARIAIRFFLESTFGQIAKNFSKHFEDFSLDGATVNPNFYEILIQTVRRIPDKKPDSTKIKPNLASSLLVSVLNGTAYPNTLFSQVIDRIRSDRQYLPLRFAIIKAYLNRLYRLQRFKENLTMSLDVNCKNQAYLLGRLFSLIESVQYYYNKDVNRNVADKYLSAASSKPAWIFPKLISMQTKYLAKIKNEKPGLAVNLSKEIMVIIESLDNAFPVHLSITEQGTFLIGYYHQRRSSIKSHSEDATLDS